MKIYQQLNKSVYTKQEGTEMKNKYSYITDSHIELAKQLAHKYHAGQVDKAGVDYFNHLDQVAKGVDTKEGKVVGYLHDILEDTPCSPKEIRKTFGYSILKAIKTLTKKGDYDKYLSKIKRNPLARTVKLSDLKHNSDLSRLPTVTDTDKQRQKKYLKAIEYLTE